MTSEQQQPAQAALNQGRRTIKLKPLTKKVPKVMAPVPEAPVQESGEVSTATTPDIELQSEPVQHMDADATIVAGSSDDSSTRKVDKEENAPAVPVLPGSRQTIKLRPTPVPQQISQAHNISHSAQTMRLTPTSGAAAPIAPSVDESEENTVSMARPETVAHGGQTIKLASPAASSSQNLAAALKGIVPGSPTLKLKPKSATSSHAAVAAPAPAALSHSAPTVKTPAPEHVPLATSVPSASKPSSITLKLRPSTSSVAAQAAVPPPPPPPMEEPVAEEQEAVPAAPIAPSLKLKSSSAPAIAVPPPPQEQEELSSPEEDEEGPTGTKPKISLNKLSATTREPISITVADKPEESVDVRTDAILKEPAEVSSPSQASRGGISIISTIAAIIAFVAMSFTVYMLSAQYYKQWISHSSAASVSAASAPAAAPAKAPAKK